jgi:hypothetical protein
LTIDHYTPAGSYIDSFSLPPSIGSEARGMAFGPEGWLYVVVVAGSDFGVVALDSSGSVKATYKGPGYVEGNLSYGKIAFGKNGQFFVGGADNLVAFTVGSPDGTVIYTNNQIFDVKGLPSGNLLVLSAYQLQEITTTGSVVKTIIPDTIISFVDARGVEFDPLTNKIYVTMLGYTGQFFQLMRFDGDTGHLEKSVYFWYGDDIFLTSDDRLIVGSRTQVPAIFDLDLNQIAVLNGGQQMFVTQMPLAASVASAPVPVLPRTLIALLCVLVIISGSAHLIYNRPFMR